MSELVLINPRRARRRKGRMPPGLARYWAGKRRKLRNPSRRKSRRRRRASSAVTVRRRRAVGYTVGSRKIRRRKLNPRSRARRRVSRIRSRRRHRNPRFGIPSVQGILRGTLMPAAVGATGALALDVAYGYASPYLPAFFSNRWATFGVKILGAIGIGMVAGRILGRERGRIATLGAATVVVYGTAKSALSQAMPTVPGLSGYQDFVDYSMQSRAPGMGFYSPAAVIQPNGVGAYLPPSGVGAYMPPGGLSGVDGYNWNNDGM